MQIPSFIGWTAYGRQAGARISGSIPLPSISASSSRLYFKFWPPGPSIFFDLWPQAHLILPSAIFRAEQKHLNFKAPKLFFSEFGPNHQISRFLSFEEVWDHYDHFYKEKS